jgi:hypothetical protein
MSGADGAKCMQDAPCLLQTRPVLGRRSRSVCRTRHVFCRRDEVCAGHAMSAADAPCLRPTKSKCMQDASCLLQTRRRRAPETSCPRPTRRSDRWPDADCRAPDGGRVVPRRFVRLGSFQVRCRAQFAARDQRGGPEDDGWIPAGVPVVPNAQPASGRAAARDVGRGVLRRRRVNCLWLNHTVPRLRDSTGAGGAVGRLQRPAGHGPCQTK